jgi:hypothetical protein
MTQTACRVNRARYADRGQGADHTGGADCSRSGCIGGHGEADGAGGHGGEDADG